MNYKIESIGNNTVIAVNRTVNENEKIEYEKTDERYYEYKMITGNNIPVFLSCKSVFENDVEIIEYNINSMRSIESLSENNKLCYTELLMLVRTLKEARETISDYLLSKEGLELDPKLIFYDTKNKSLRYCFYPWEEMEQFASYSKLSEFLLSAIDYQDEKAVDLVYKMYASVLNKDYEFEKLVKDELQPKSPNEYEINVEDNVRRELDIERVSYRLSTLSVICFTLFVTFSISLMTLSCVSRRLFIHLMSNPTTISVISVIMCLLAFIPISNISDIRRTKRRAVRVQKTC